ncbi:MAG: hypothetical protein ACE5JD_08525 [Candidatus Methylomirabilia bacterium]
MRHRSLAFFAVVVAYALLPTALLAASGTAGKPAPDITVRTADGEFRLSEHRGKVLVLFFSFPG